MQAFVSYVDLKISIFLLNLRLNYFGIFLPHVVINLVMFCRRIGTQVGL